MPILLRHAVVKNLIPSKLLSRHSQDRTIQHISGRIEAEPHVVKSGLIKLSIATIASIYVGGKIAQKAATFLEENEIFVHSEEDDDD